MIRSFGSSAPQFGQGVFVAETASVLGAVELANEANIWHGAVLRGDVGKIKVGARSNIQDNATVHMTWEVSDAIIGQEVVVGHNAVIHGAVIEDRALIGMGAIVMDNARIGEGAWVAAGSVVPPSTIVTPGTLYRGSPAKAARPVKPEEAEWAKGAIERYLGLAREHQRQQELDGIPGASATRGAH